MKGWISVNKYVPASNDEVLVYAPNCHIIGSVLVGCYFEDTDSWTVYDFGESSLDESEYIEGYELRGDEGDYTPSEDERFLIEDAIRGLMEEDSLKEYFSNLLIEVKCEECVFCIENCEHLSHSATEQNKHKIKGIHYCHRYKRQVLHCNDYPKLHRVNECHLACNCNTGKVLSPLKEGLRGTIKKVEVK